MSQPLQKSPLPLIQIHHHPAEGLQKIIIYYFFVIINFNIITFMYYFNKLCPGLLFIILF
jgi:hypothetical protein